jgi:hypothetical protein
MCSRSQLGRVDGDGRGGSIMRQHVICADNRVRALSRLTASGYRVLGEEKTRSGRDFDSMNERHSYDEEEVGSRSAASSKRRGKRKRGSG